MNYSNAVKCIILTRNNFNSIRKNRRKPEAIELRNVAYDWECGATRITAGVEVNCCVLRVIKTDRTDLLFTCPTYVCARRHVEGRILINAPLNTTHTLTTKLLLLPNTLNSSTKQ